MTNPRAARSVAIVALLCIGAAACGMRDQVHFTGYLPAAEVSRLLQAADAAAFPFNSGVTRKSGSLLTALAAGPRPRACSGCRRATPQR